MGTPLPDRSMFLLVGLVAAVCPAWLGAQVLRIQGNAPAGPVPNYVLQARVVAVGVRDVGGVRQVGFFHAGGPIAGNPEFLLKTRPGRVLDPGRILVASGSNFGLPLAISKQAAGSILSIDPQNASTVVVAHDFAAGVVRGGAGKSANPALQLFSAQSPAYSNRVYNRGARTADEPAVSNPRYISINNAFGRPWFASSPFGASGAGASSVLDPDGRPLDNAPSDIAGGVFAGTTTDRVTTLIAPPHSRPPSLIDKWLKYRASGQLTAGSLSHGALGTAFLGASPDTTGFAVFALVLGDGSLVQVHVQDGVDGLAPPGTIAPVADDVSVAGMAFRWIPDRALFVADRARDRIAVLELTDDGRHFKLDRVRSLSAAEFKAPIDLAAAIPEVANPRFSSHTTLAANSDLFVANRGDGSLLRMTLDGRVLARAQVQVEGLGVIGADRLRAIAVSADAQRIWLTLEGKLPQYREYEGLVLEVAAFDSNGPYRQAQLTAPIEPRSDVTGTGALLFAREFSPGDGLGPLFNQRSCVACHNEPNAGGSSSAEANFALRVARSTGASGRVERLDDGHGPVARRHSTRELLGGKGENKRDPLAQLAGIPRDANVVSIRMPLALYAAGALDGIPDAAILAHAVSKGDGIRGRPNRVRDSSGELRVGRYGWKADIAQLDEMVANALATEIGISTPLAAADARSESRGVDDDGGIVRALVAYLKTLTLPARESAK
jgi:hypothetical protein